MLFYSFSFTGNKGALKILSVVKQYSHMKQMECLLKILNEISEGDQVA